jgi:sugar lactone lactonase YvrE
MNRAFATLTATLALVLATPNAGIAETVDLARFRQLRSEGVAAVNAGDLALASRKLAEASALLPTHPGLLLMQARVAAADERAGDAIGFLRQYAEMGLHADISRDPAMQGVAGSPEFTAVSDAMTANRQPRGALSQLARTAELRLLEGLAWQKLTGRLLVSSIRERMIFEMSPDGALTPWLADVQPLGIYGIAIDEGSNRLWAATSGSVEALVAEADQGRAELLEIDLLSRRVIQRYAAPAAPTRAFGDVAVGPDGSVAVSDSTNGDVLLLRAGEDALDVLVPSGQLGSPQGLLFSQDGTVLLLADYSSGLHTVDLRSGQMDALTSPPRETLISADGLAQASDGSVWVVQNGVSPHRLVRLSLSQDWRSVSDLSVEVANQPEMDQPTGIAVDDRGIVLIQQSQWGRFDQTGALRPGGDQAAIIARLSLGTSAASAGAVRLQ